MRHIDVTGEEVAPIWPSPRLRPGSLATLAASGAASLIALDASSRHSLLQGAVALWIGLALLAVCVFGILRARSRRTTGQAGNATSWAMALGLLVLSYALSITDLPADVRFALSRSALDRAASDVMAGRPVPTGWIGLYPIENVERTPHGMRFLVSGAGFLDRFGYAYSERGEPPNVTGLDEYEAVGDGWWAWVERF